MTLTIPIDAAPMRQLVLTTWNMFGVAHDLRSFLRWRGIADSSRLTHPSIAAELAEVDIVCMQEVFLGDAEEFFDRLPHPHKHRDSNETRMWPFTVGGSGLALASKHPILDRGLHPFSRPQLSSERFARKGILFARIDVGDAHVDVITTHMQAGYTVAARRVRERQLREMRDLVDRWSHPENPLIVSGDFNICGLKSDEVSGEYQSLRAHFADFLDVGISENRPTFHPHPEVNSLAHRFEQTAAPQRIDYFLVRVPPTKSGVRVRDSGIRFDQRLEVSGSSTFASDHFGLRVSIDY